MAQSFEAIGFNRVATGALGFSAGNFGLVCSVPNTVSKELNSIHISVADGSSPYVIEEYQIRVMVSDQQLRLGTVLSFSPSNVSGIDDYGDPGNVYYDHVITLPYNNPILFDTPMQFPGATKIFVTCSFAQANGDSIVAPPNRFVRMSINGRLLETPSLQYKQR